MKIYQRTDGKEQRTIVMKASRPDIQQAAIMKSRDRQMNQSRQMLMGGNQDTTYTIQAMSLRPICGVRSDFATPLLCNSYGLLNKIIYNNSKFYLSDSAYILEIIMT